MGRGLVFALAATLLLVCGAPLARAHLMPAGQGTLRLVGPSGWLALAVPLEVLHGWDDDGDGRMSLQELQFHAAPLRAQLRQRVVLTDGGDPGRIGYEDLVQSVPDAGEGRAPQTLVLLRQVSWARAPRAPTLRVDLFGAATGATAQLSLRALHDERVDVALFDAAHRERALFRGPLRIFVDHVATGVGHILGGFDHLLFLLTLLVAGTG